MWDGYMLSESTKTECFENQFCDGNHLHFFSEPKRSGWSIQLAVDSSDNFTINVVKSDLEYLARLIAPLSWLLQPDWPSVIARSRSFPPN
jgi:hypothetical protein